MSTNYIIENLKREIDNFSSQIKAEKIGHVLEVFDGIAKVSGLSLIKSSEMVTFPNGEIGVALNLEEDTIGVIILSDFSKIKEGDEVKATGKILEVPVSENIIGDHQTGKTAIAIDTILNQKGQNMICVYVSIGQKDSKLRKIQTRLEE